jgi:hypothetical protein
MRFYLKESPELPGTVWVSSDAGGLVFRVGVEDR